MVFLFGVKTDPSNRHRQGAMRIEQWFPEMRYASARINHGPCQILWERKCQRAACHHKEKLKWQQPPPKAGNSENVPWKLFPFVRSWQCQDPNPFAPENNYKFHLYNPWKLTKCFHGVLSYGFYLSVEGVDSSDVKPSNPPASARLSRPVSLPNWSHGHCGHPLGCDFLPLNGLPFSNLKNGKSWLWIMSVGEMF